jgi:hypothetical protein
MFKKLSILCASIDCRCQNCCLAQSPDTLVVKGAGNQAVNGVYTKMGDLKENAAKYVMRGARNGAPTNYYIMLCSVVSFSYRWFLYCQPNEPWSDGKVYYYSVWEPQRLAIFPPADGWTLKKEGRYPPPTIVYAPQYHLARLASLSNTASRLKAPCMTPILSNNTFDPLIREASLYWRLVQTMNIQSDRERLCTAIFHFVFADPGNVDAARNKTLQLMNVSFRREQCFVLELAVWKYVCTMRGPTSNAAGVLAWSNWYREGWKTRKLEVRRSNAFHVILTAVIPFLDPLVNLSL